MRSSIGQHHVRAHARITEAYLLVIVLTPIGTTNAQEERFNAGSTT
jgi:hypothetical protein